MSDSKTYGIVGNGRMAKHMMHYFDTLGISYSMWDRKSEFTVQQMFTDVDACLILVRDDAIEDVLTQHEFLRSKPCVHFSGSVITSDGNQYQSNVKVCLPLSYPMYSCHSATQFPF